MTELEAAGVAVPADGSPSTGSPPRRSAGCGAGEDRAERDPLLPDYRREPDAKPAPAPPPSRIRRLTYADLPQVVAIERRAFPTPWSLAMFVLELSKPSGVCLARTSRDEVVGYLVCSRYDTVWHIMNVAVDPRRRRHGIATALLTRLFERVDDPHAQYTLEVRRSNEARDRALRALRLPRGRTAPLLPRQRRGRGHHVAHARRRCAARSTTCRTPCRP